MYAGTVTGLKKTDDGGLTWRDLGFGATRINGLAIDPVNPLIVYVGLQGRVLKSADAGASWNVVLTAAGTRFVSDIIVDPNNPDTVYVATQGAGLQRSDDQGETWNAVAGLPDINVQKFALGNNGGNYIYVKTGKGMYVTTDRGVTWREAGLNARTVTAIVVDSTDPEIVYAAVVQRGVLRSTNGGLRWEDFNAGLTDSHAATMIPDRAAPGTLLLASSRSGLFTSPMAQPRWQELGTVDLYASITAISVAPNGAEIIAGSRQGLFASADKGGSWRFLYGDLQTSAIYSLVRDPVDPRRLFAAAGTLGVSLSENGGNAWRRVNLGLEGVDVQQLVVNPSVATTLYASGPAGVWRTVNGAATWFNVLADVAVNVLAVSPMAPAEVFAATGDGLFKSSNFGADWQAIDSDLPDGDVTALLVHPLDAQLLYAAVNGHGVLRSNDSGLTWRDYSPGLADDIAIRRLVIDANRPDALLAATSVGVLVRDGIANEWVELNTGLDATDVLALEVHVSSGELFAGLAEDGMRQALFQTFPQAPRPAPGPPPAPAPAPADDNGGLGSVTWIGAFVLLTAVFGEFRLARLRRSPRVLSSAACPDTTTTNQSPA
jgi:photosystem II stability/assembly factor-like uncharacterized protein